ncbi:hypothetical protein ACN28E_03375 [Archangium lansingense]|uniref:hypothetical protein n=1 Tax=Archangium lansingense TaxID=2995310 RepID=UPI003B77C398
MRLRIAVIGSADTNRQYTPALVSPQEAKAAARAIGAQLANTGCKLLVFSAKFIEQEVVEGYASSEQAETVQLGVLVEQESPRQPPAGRGPAPTGTPSPAGT